MFIDEKALMNDNITISIIFYMLASCILANKLNCFMWII